MNELANLPEFRSFLRAIRDNLESDLHRLVLADWLEENGESNRAEFIRLQIEHANTSCTDPNSTQGVSDRTRCVTASCDHCRKGERIEELLGYTSIRGDQQFEAVREAEWTHFGTEAIEGRGSSAMLQWDRGFVSEVSCLLVWWIGGTCSECGGSGRTEFDPALNRDWHCATCNAGGAVEPHGPRLVELHAIERVDVLDGDPDHLDSEATWLRGDEWDGVATLPAELFDLLPDDDCEGSGDRWKQYGSRQFAYDALSAACIKWAALWVPTSE